MFIVQNPYIIEIVHQKSKLISPMNNNHTGVLVNQRLKLEDALADRCLVSVSPLQKLEEQDRKALNVKEQLQREHRYLKRRLEQLSVSGSVERIRTDSMGSTISTDSEQGASA